MLTNPGDSQKIKWYIGIRYRYNTFWCSSQHLCQIICSTSYKLFTHLVYNQYDAEGCSIKVQGLLHQNVTSPTIVTLKRINTHKHILPCNTSRVILYHTVALESTDCHHTVSQMLWKLYFTFSVCQFLILQIHFGYCSKSRLIFSPTYEPTWNPSICTLHVHGAVVHSLLTS